MQLVQSAETLASKEKISNLVRDYFGLEEKSFSIFRERLFNPEIDPVYEALINDNDLRFRTEVQDESFLLSLDRAWGTFSYKYKDFCDFYNLTYSDFQKGRIIYHKNEYKILKLAASFFEEKYSAYDLKYIIEDIEKILGRRITNSKNSKCQVVLSLNFVDWFLCSTSESWSSCLNLESDYEQSYWSGLPGTVIDKNRAMLYITNGKRKNYSGIETDKMLCRTWVLLDKEDLLNVVRFFPHSIFELESLSDKYFNGKLVRQSDNYESKHKISLLSHDNGDSCYIYQDSTTFSGSKKNCNLTEASSGNYWRFDKSGNIRSGTAFYSSGLSSIIDSGIKITETPEEKVWCCECDREVPEDEVRFDRNGVAYCEECYFAIYTRCHDCDTEILIDEAMEGTNEELYCEECFDDRFAICSECDEVIRKSDVKEFDSTIYCSDCFERLFVECKECFNIVEKSYTAKNTLGNVVCMDCYHNEVLEILKVAKKQN